MKPLRVAIDVQHAYRSGLHRWDRGSRFVGPGGLVHYESDLARQYAVVARLALEGAGVAVLTNDPMRGVLVGPYSRRNRAAAAWGADAYLACHVNAGRGLYARCEYLPGTPGYGLGSAIAGQLFRLPEIVNAYPFVLNKGERGHVCIAACGERVAATLLEPFFGDQVRHGAFLTTPGLARIGEAIAAGVLQWWKTTQG